MLFRDKYFSTRSCKHVVLATDWHAQAMPPCLCLGNTVSLQYYHCGSSAAAVVFAFIVVVIVIVVKLCAVVVAVVVVIVVVVLGAVVVVIVVVVVLTAFSFFFFLFLIVCPILSLAFLSRVLRHQDFAIITNVILG